MRPFLLTILGLTLAGFVTSAKASSTHFDPGYHRKYTCQQLLDEGREVSAKAVTLSGETDNGRATKLASIADVVVMPQVILDGKPVSNELTLIKQQMLAIEDASIQAQCAIEFHSSANK